MCGNNKFKNVSFDLIEKQNKIYSDTYIKYTPNNQLTYLLNTYIKKYYYLNVIKKYNTYYLNEYEYYFCMYYYS